MFKIANILIKCWSNTDYEQLLIPKDSVIVIIDCKVSGFIESEILFNGRYHRANFSLNAWRNLFDL